MKKKAKYPSTKAIPSLVSFNKLLLTSLLVATVAIYYVSLKNGFTNWDDPDNVTSNADLRTFHGDSVGYTLKKIFSVRDYMGMYAPLSNLSYCIQYQESQLDPQAYHLANLILHLLNSALVFYFVLLLAKRQWVAFITALLFALHPMHVEPVAWITGRIDVLYSLFYLAALCTYLLYLQSVNHKWYLYALTFILFVLAVFTKAAAVTLPVVFVTLDYFLARKITGKTILEKAPFVLISLIIGFLAIYVQKEMPFVSGSVHYTFFDKTLFSCYALVMYLWKLVVPVNLSCLYKFPIKQPSVLFSGKQMYPIIFYIAPFLVMMVAFLVYMSKEYGKVVFFGTAFFLTNIVLVLPGLAARKMIIADRYTYISYIGLFFIIAYGLNSLWEGKSEKFQSIKMPSRVALILFLVWYSYLTMQACKVWHDSMTLWNNAILVDPDCAEAYSSRGKNYYALGETQEALEDFNKAISLNPNDAIVFYGRGNSNYLLKRYNEAIQDYSSAILIDPNYAEAYCNRGTAYSNLKRYDEAKKDYYSAIRIYPNYAEVYNNLGNDCFALGKNEEAIKDFDSAIRININNPAAYNGRGNCNYMLQRYNEAARDYTSAILINPNYTDAYSNRYRAYFMLQKYQLALDDAIRASQLGANIEPGVFQMIQANIK